MSDDLDFDMEVVKNEDLGSSETDSDPNSGESPRSGIGKLDGERTESSGDKRRIGRKESTGSSSSTTDAFEEKKGSSGEPQGPELIDGVLWSKLNCVPDGWDLVNLGPEVSIQTGYNAPSENFVEEGGIPLIRNRDLGSSETEIQYDGDYGDEYVIEEGDLLVSMDGEFEPHLWTGGKALLNQRVCKVEGSESFNHIFLTYAIEKPLYLLQKSIAGTTVKHLSKSNIRSVNLPTPPLPEQRKIASVLYAVDQAIQKTEEIIDQAKRVKWGLMQKVFLYGLDSGGDIRDPEISPGDFKSLNLGGFEERLIEKGRVPESWNYLPLEECLSEFVSGAAISSGEFSEEGFPVVAKGDVTDDEVIDLTSDRQHVPVETAQKYSSSVVDSSYVVVSLRDLVPSAPTVGSASFVDAEGQFLLAQGAYGLSLDEQKLNPKFFVTLTRCHYFRSYMKRMAVGSTQVHVRSSEYKSMCIPVPPIEEQRRISALFEAIDGQIRNAQSRVFNFKNLKKGLMQDLLTGEVRTADKAIEVLEEVQAHG